MVSAGIEAMNVFGGTAYLDVMELAKYRHLDTARFENLLMKEKAVALPYEDPVTFGVNAAKPIIDALSEAEKERIELLITCSESGIDFGKSLSTYIHEYLGLNRNCRLFEIKQACYSGTAGFQMAVNFILSQTSPGAKALVIASDISRFLIAEGGDALSEDWSYAEPSAGAGAVAVLVGENPEVFQIDPGANGYYGYEVMDTCRPIPDSEAGDSDLSLMSYLDCCEQTFLEYQKRVPGASYQDTFQYLAYHTPFGGMVKGAHRTMMRKVAKMKTAEIETDFLNRVMPGLNYCQRVGNIMGAALFLALASTIDQGRFDSPKRIGCFSYGSGCCSEFYSGITTPQGQERQRSFGIENHLDRRYQLSMDEYELLFKGSGMVRFGTRNVKLDFEMIPGIMQFTKKKPRLFLEEISEFHRKYRWIS
ncbi:MULTISPECIES: polyketide biosynthesis 3-hydroxy-3-methylglutaryl-ACP synthase PksG [Bacillus]|uniref:TaC protein n=1 Tax=Bacillus spizizenii (strain DSM 15029 / JCM 12233 / NBRC 101239 / NRRL B-23049 / TU-B-10) TaxID=1052585 RepID=G4NVE3_BACS4|nr:polyketide biosynthesis 3-hydroxy-3-methylglutaryl-ACP synthase PksG [Bacillus spizizenii]APH68610.1 3-hydroxy-3-methylglutaryl-ACP synthase [Bacillus subtilis]CUB23367.1 Polyketide biosynthesis 3-hydroxy-3-methylglutaryl-ACP synthase PksG [Bacillus cereus]AEP86704.1 TaC protein [Bacillus spizizenii TU-B-10]MEC1436274.1 polyketide biosynthesis 3-hydroxy-3-methylglutaryl-ACP synthase PksG [Bacillus spizizenii]MED0870691.1 polyketide biosynthesis 3-hydroxy-3-methylglutaryl-ACP synthase PksG [